MNNGSSISNRLIYAFKNFIDLIYPRLCSNCQDQLSESEKILCASCKSSLPILDYTSQHEIISSKFFDVNPKYSFCYLFYNKGNITQKLLYSFKYNGQIQVGEKLGRWFAHQISDYINTSEIDLITPVPLHRSKKRKRGFNQSEILALMLSEELNIKMTNALKRLTSTSSQTKKSRVDRIFNVKDIFEVKNSKNIEGKHILIIDDVITTGSTIASCATTLLENGARAISVASLAIAR